MWFVGLEDGEAMLGNGREEETWAVGGSQEKDLITYGTQTLNLVCRREDRHFPPSPQMGTSPSTKSTGFEGGKWWGDATWMVEEVMGKSTKLGKWFDPFEVTVKVFLLTNKVRRSKYEVSCCNNTYPQTTYAGENGTNLWQVVDPRVQKRIKTILVTTSCHYTQKRTNLCY